jgi:hypothetical protein
MVHKIDEALSNRQLTENSKNLYKRNLLKLNDNKEIKNFNFLKNKDEVLTKIKDLKPTTQRSYIISICSILRDNTKMKKTYDEYFELLKSYNDTLRVNNEKSTTQEKNWITQEEVLKVHKTLKEDIENSLSKKRKIDKQLFKKLLNYMILSLYTLIQPRRNKDYSLMRISSNMNDTNFNYLVIEKSRSEKSRSDFRNPQGGFDFRNPQGGFYKKNNMKFILNNYKTEKKYHSVEIDIPDDLKQVILLYLKYHPLKLELKNKEFNIPFLVEDGKELKSSTEITKILNKIFDKKISSSMLRNIFLTSKYGDLVNELKEDTKQMGTSSDVALNNYIKTD